MLGSTLTLAQRNNIEALLSEAEAQLLPHPAQASRLSESAERMIAAQQLDSYRPWLLNLQAHLHILSNDYIKAFQTADRAEQLAVAADNRVQIAEALRKKGLVTFMLQSDAEALELLTKSLKLHRELDSKYVLNNLHAIGNIYDRNDEWVDNLISLGYTLAQEATQKDDVFFQELGYSFVIAGLNKKGEYQAAKRVFEKAAGLIDQPRHSLLYQGARTEFRLGNDQASMALTDTVLQHNTEMAPFILFPVFVLRADILIAQGNVEEGQALLLSTLDKATKIAFADMQQDAALKLANLFGMQKDYKRAAHYHKLHKELLVEAFEKKQSQQLAFNQVRLELEQKNQRISELTASQQFSEQSNTYKTFIIILFICLLFAITAYAFIVARQKRELYADSEELRKTQDTFTSSNSKLSLLARTDELTGLANRRVCDEFIEAEWKHATRSRSALSVMLVNVDHFKQYSDTHGHELGDACLKAIAAVLRDAMRRPKDLIARYGGEEFICVLPDTPMTGAIRVAEDIQRNINQEAIPHQGSPTFPFVTLSIGIASHRPHEAHSPQALISRAKFCLYEAKDAGRNCIRH